MHYTQWRKICIISISYYNGYIHLLVLFPLVSRYCFQFTYSTRVCKHQLFLWRPTGPVACGPDYKATWLRVRVSQKANIYAMTTSIFTWLMDFEYYIYVYESPQLKSISRRTSSHRDVDSLIGVSTMSIGGFSDAYLFVMFLLHCCLYGGHNKHNNTALDNRSFIFHFINWPRLTAQSFLQNYYY